MSDAVIHDNTADPVTDGVTGFANVSFSFTTPNQPGYGLSEVDLGLYYAGTSQSLAHGSVDVSLGTGYTTLPSPGNPAASATSHLAEIGRAYDDGLPSSPGSLYRFVLDAPISLAPSTRYVIEVDIGFGSLSALEFSASTAGTDIAGEGYSDSTLARSYGAGPNSPTGSYVARIIETPSSTAVVAPVCYAAGTLILTARGEVPIEALREGDLLFSPRTGTHVPALWIARQRVRDPAHRAVRIAAGAFAPGRPHTDLVVSPNHSLFLDGILVPAFRLVNGATIRWEPRPAIDYFHIECPQHDLLLANGTPSESWLDYGNRHAFDNATERPAAVPIHRPLIEAEPAPLPQHCVPCLQEGPAVTAVRRALQRRAIALGSVMTGDEGLHLLADGARIEPAWVRPRTAAFRPPPTARSLRLMSRTVRPQDRFDTADARTLGVAVGRLSLAGMTAGLAALDGLGGWWPIEGADTPFRWTDGAGTLPPCTGLIQVELAQPAIYLAAAPPRVPATIARAA